MSNNVFIDTSLPTKAQSLTLKYIRNNITNNIDTISIDDFAELVKNFKLKNGKMLAYGSIKCLFYTMYKHRMGDWDIKKMKAAKNKFWDITSHRSGESYNVEMEGVIKDMIEYFISYLFDKVPSVNLTFKDVAIAIYITLATNLRISEIKQLTKKHIIQMMNDEIVTIRIKKKRKPIKIMANKKMLDKFLFNQKIKTLDDNQPLIRISKSLINETIRKYISTKTSITENQKFGIQSIRKVNTTIIIQSLNLQVAQNFNRHSNANTTFHHYNTKTYINTVIDNVINKEFNF
ncbi:VLF-1a [Penaeus vannamei nudivirus]|nr:hypothetical protein PvSNPV_040 [Penaeus vannamei nucleopolyhedrovirus]